MNSWAFACSAARSISARLASGFACARRSHKCGQLPRLDGQAYILENWILLSVVKLDMIKFDLSFKARGTGRAGKVLNFFICFEDLLDALVSNQRF